MNRLACGAAILLLGAQLTACSARTQDDKSSIPVIATQAPASAPAATNKENISEQSISTTEPVIEEQKPASPLYKMSNVYRFVPIQEGTTDKVVLLTFDDGPNNESVLTSLLDTLDKHNAKAIFFVNGYRVKKNPELLKLIHERGQTIGNHSWDHINLKNEKDEVVEQQLADVQTEINALIGQNPLFFRPPYGSGGDSVKKIAKNHGMLFMTWSNGSLDWDKSTKDKPDEVIRNVMEQLHPGANILMHEVQWTADALDELLTKLEDKGYGFIDPSTIDVTH